MHLRIAFPLLLAAALAGCSENSTGPGPVAKSYTFTFENGAQGWEAHGADLELDGQTIPWAVMRSRDRATSDSWSMRFFMNNLNDAGKIWMQRAFTLEPDTTYTVSIEYDFATADYGDLNHFTIIAGASAQPPQNGKGLNFQADTGNGARSDVGHIWLEKRHTFTVDTGPDGMVYIVLGVWGTWETARTYYIDTVDIRFSEAGE